MEKCTVILIVFLGFIASSLCIYCVRFFILKKKMLMHLQKNKRTRWLELVGDQGSGVRIKELSAFWKYVRSNLDDEDEKVLRFKDQLKICFLSICANLGAFFVVKGMLMSSKYLVMN